MYPFSISTDEHVPLNFLMTKYFIVINHRYIHNMHITFFYIIFTDIRIKKYLEMKDM